MGEISKSKIAEHSWDEENKIKLNKTEIIHKNKTGLLRN
jgi:hypothetical protein